jgi:hypothetical protein
LKNINIQKTDNSPEVTLDYENGFIEFDGKSYPENTFDFYEPLTEWLKEYFTSAYKPATTVNIKLTYFNSASTQILFDIFDIIQESECEDLVINWYYDSENENGLEDYEDYSEEFEDLNMKAIAYGKED